MTGIIVEEKEADNLAEEEKQKVLGFFETHLSLWVIRGIIIGVSIGEFFSGVLEFSSRFEYAGVSIPVAMLI